MYQEMIRAELSKSGFIGKYDPRHIEAYMRLEHSTLDGLSASQFKAEVEIGRQCVDAEGAAIAETLAVSFEL